MAVVTGKQSVYSTDAGHLQMLRFVIAVHKDRPITPSTCSLTVNTSADGPVTHVFTDAAGRDEFFAALCTALKDYVPS